MWWGSVLIPRGRAQVAPEHGGHLPSDGGFPGNKGAIVSLDDLLVHGPGHGVRSPSGEVSQVGEVHNRARTGRRAAVVTPEHGGQLLPGDLAVRGEGGGAGTLMTPFSWAQATAWVYQVSAGTSEKVTSPETAGSPGHAVEDGGHHGTGHGGVGRERGLTGALHDAGGIEIAGSSGGVVGGRVFVGVDQGSDSTKLTWTWKGEAGMTKE